LAAGSSTLAMAKLLCTGREEGWAPPPILAVSRDRTPSARASRQASALPRRQTAAPRPARGPRSTADLARGRAAMARGRASRGAWTGWSRAMGLAAPATGARAELGRDLGKEGRLGSWAARWPVGRPRQGRAAAQGLLATTPGGAAGLGRTTEGKGSTRGLAERKRTARPGDREDYSSGKENDATRGCRERPSRGREDGEGKRGERTHREPPCTGTTASSRF
jgi:hypothetical protein